MPTDRCPTQIDASHRNGACSPSAPHHRGRGPRLRADAPGARVHHHARPGARGRGPVRAGGGRRAGSWRKIAVVGEIEARLAPRLAVAFWNGERAERSKSSGQGTISDWKPRVASAPAPGIAQDIRPIEPASVRLRSVGRCRKTQPGPWHRRQSIRRRAETESSPSQRCARPLGGKSLPPSDRS